MDGLIVMVIWYIFWVVAVGLLQCRLGSCVSPVMDIKSPKTDHGFSVPSRLSSSPNCMSYHSPTYSQPMASFFSLSIPVALQHSITYCPLLSYNIALLPPLKMPNVPRKTVLGSSSFSYSNPIIVSLGLHRYCVPSKIYVFVMINNES